MFTPHPEKLPEDKNDIFKWLNQEDGILVRPNLEMIRISSQVLLFAEVIKQQQRAMENFRAILTNSFSFPRFDIDIVNGQIVGEEPQPRTQIIPVTPKVIQIQTARAILQSPLGISYLSSGTIMYKRKVLRYFSRSNIAGKFLFLLLSRNPHVVTYEDIHYFSDVDRSVSATSFCRWNQ